MDKRSLVIIAILSIAFLSNPASAETGSITVSNQTNANWSDYRPWPGYTEKKIIEFNQFAFDTGNFTSVVNYTVYDPDNRIAFVNPNEITSFTCQNNCTGGGTASYSAFLHRLTWVFNSGFTVTGSPFNITYSHPIFLNATLSAGGAPLDGYDMVSNPNVVSSINNSMPMWVYNVTSGNPQTLKGSDVGGVTKRMIFSGIFSSGTVTNSYVITYPNAGFYLATINKSGQTIFTKDFLHTQSNDSQGYFAESTLNNNSFQVLMPQLDGIYINVTMGTGDFNDVLINTSGSTITPSPTPQPTATPPQQGSNGFGIAFNAGAYSVNDIAQVSTNSSFGLLNFDSYRVEIYSDTIPLLATYDMDKSQQTQTFFIQLPKEGQYTANLIERSFILGTDEIKASDGAQVTRNQSYLFVPSTVSVGSINNISWQVGYTPDHSSDTINIRIYDANGSLESIYGVSNANTTADIRYFTNVRYLKSGTYTTQLTSSVFGVLDSKASQAYFTPKNVTRNILPPSFINVSQSFYAFSDTIDYGYQIDDANYSNYTNYIAVFNWNQSVTTRTIDTCGRQWMWETQLPIINGLVFNGNCDTYDLQNDGFLPGLNKLSLRGQNSTADIELAYVNFTISSTDAAGWGLSVDKTTACIGDTIRAKVIVPGTSAGTLRYGMSGQLVNVSVNSTITLPFTATANGNLLFELYDQTGALRFPQTVTIKGCAVSGEPPTTPGGSEAVTSLGDNLLIFMAMPAFWGLIILVLVVWICAVKAPQAVAMCVFIAANIEAVIGLWDPFMWYILVITWIIAGIYFKMSRDTVTGVK